MAGRIVPVALVCAILGAAAIAFFRAPVASSEGGEDTSREPDTARPAAETRLPPGHPALGAVPPPHGAAGFAGPDEPAALAWTVPAAWNVAPNPNAFRLATYRVSADPNDPTEVTVSRAGGSADANIRRWIAQFDDAGADTRTDRKVNDVDVIVVQVSGTYTGDGMMPGSNAEPKKGWTLVGAIAAGGGTPYFFKMLGPTARVRAARPAFDAMIASLTRRRS